MRHNIVEQQQSTIHHFTCHDILFQVTTYRQTSKVQPRQTSWSTINLYSTTALHSVCCVTACNLLNFELVLLFLSLFLLLQVYVWYVQKYYLLIYTVFILHIYCQEVWNGLYISPQHQMSNNSRWIKSAAVPRVLRISSSLSITYHVPSEQHWCMAVKPVLWPCLTIYHIIMTCQVMSSQVKSSSL